MSTWRLTEDNRTIRLREAPISKEVELEELLEKNPELILDEPLLVIGRQNPTDLGKALDLLAIDASGRTVVAELKKAQTPRQVVAQALEYASYIATLDYGQLNEMACRYFSDTKREKKWGSLVEAFGATFRLESAVPDPQEISWNGHQRIVIVAEQVTEDVARVCSYLRRNRLDVAAVEVGLLREPGQDQFVTSQLVVGFEPTEGQDAPSVADVEAIIPSDYRSMVDALRRELTLRLNLREHSTAKGFSYSSRGSGPGQRIAGLYFNHGRPQLYVYDVAARYVKGSAQAFYSAVKAAGADTLGIPNTAVNLRKDESVEGVVEAIERFVLTPSTETPSK